VFVPDDRPRADPKLPGNLALGPSQDASQVADALAERESRRELTIVGEYIDKMTGSKDSRPALNRLMADASRRKFDAVLVWKLDRFGRSLRHLVNALAELEAFGLSFISLRDNLDLSTPSGPSVNYSVTKS
jgi:DNA invertase Pin-like site-specific DNA recombinase